MVEAAVRKYPNPQNPNVVGMDVITRDVGKDGVLRSHRLMQTKWSMPEFLTSVSIVAKIKQNSQVEKNSFS